MKNQEKEIYEMHLLVQRAQAFADATRMRIRLLILEGEATVSDIVHASVFHSPVSRPTSPSYAKWVWCRLIILDARGLEPNEQAEQPRPLYRLTLLGTQALRARGVNVTRAEKTRRRWAFGCIDWTERRMHLGGALGAAILEAMLTAGMVRRRQFVIIEDKLQLIRHRG